MISVNYFPNADNSSNWRLSITDLISSENGKMSEAEWGLAQMNSLVLHGWEQEDRTYGWDRISPSGTLCSIDINNGVF